VRIDRKQPFEDNDDAACRVCGRVTDLTFEHLPPSSAGNEGRAEMLGIDEWLQRDETGKPERGKIVQRGSGAYTLCGACNNRAGQLYVPEFKRWTDMAGMGLANIRPPLQQLDAALEPAYTTAAFKRVQPARFLKQVTTMILALAAPGFPPRHLDLQAFAQDPEWVGLPPNYQFYLALYCGPIARFNGGAGVLRMTEDGAQTTFTLELAHPPFAYILSVDEDSPAIETGNISNFADLGINQTADLELPLRVGFGHTPFPLDLRSKAMLERDRAANEAEAEKLRSRR
jgi:hypothetical protein